MAGASEEARAQLRWRLADESDTPQQALFEEEPPAWRAGHGEFRGLEFLEVRAQRVINAVPPQSRVSFRWTINAYRGCSHACSFCFARPTHEYLNLNTGDDFERRIVVKINAVERVRAEVAAKRWAGDLIAMGTNTDPYQRCEGKYRLTRGIVEVLGEARNPFSILTKSTLILRDLDVLADAARRTRVQTAFSVGTVDDDVWRLSEPGTPHPRRRLEALVRLREAGVPVGVLAAPILPGISDSPAQLEALARALVDAGVETATPIVLHLRPGVKEHYLAWLAGARPELLERYDRIYGRRSYAPKAVQAEITARFRAALAAARSDRRSSLTPPVR
ncbi:MAG TPA: radical SAM protein [Acidimicrobiia bacterium]|nr:radical SAM protein [Acidimicrobiia bacterium]